MNNNKPSVKVYAIVIGIIILISILISCLSGSSSSSSSSRPWEELGVSEREYMNVYNHIKYGY